MGSTDMFVAMMVVSFALIIMFVLATLSTSSLIYLTGKLLRKKWTFGYCVRVGFLVAFGLFVIYSLAPLILYKQIEVCSPEVFKWTYYNTSQLEIHNMSYNISYSSDKHCESQRLLRWEKPEVLP